MTLVKPKADAREAWQYTGQPRSEWPAWVQACVLTCGSHGSPYDGQPLLSRRSGTQVLKHSEWIVRDLDSRDPEWLTHDQMRKTYDEVVG